MAKSKPSPSAAPAATEKAKSTVSWDLLEDNTITRNDGKETITVATLNGKAIEYATADLRKRFHPAVVQFLTDEEIEFDNDLITVADTPGADLVVDENSDEFNAGIPSPPKQNIRQGDKTPAYVDWLFKYKPNTFKQKYGIIGRGTVIRRHVTVDPVTGREKRIEIPEENVLLATRKTHLTELKDAEVANADEYEVKK